MTDYTMIYAKLDAMLQGETHALSCMANVAALLGEDIEDINWAGFYIMHKGELLLGPFYGKVACMHISLDKGVCGAAAMQDEIQMVRDVHDFAGHIACDSASQSEIVLPLHANGKVVAVLDVDSPYIARFNSDDKAGLYRIATLLESRLCLTDLQY
ncbi:MAG: GAF domain-containing protein [Oscillospiraceae bacterium]